MTVKRTHACAIGRPQRIAAGTIAGWLAICALAVPAAHAGPPRGACSNPEPGRPAIRPLPWAQDLLEPERVWPQTIGAGVTVAVIDSGVDADQPQLRGRTLPGRDFYLVGQLPGNYDCASHGTAVAGIIAAAPTTGIGFHGVAPGVKILPVRVTDREAAEGESSRTVDPDVLARGIVYAVDQGAKVINLSMAGSQNRRQVRQAVAYAVRKDVVVVASVGNRQSNQAESLPSYPASYPGVLGVGAIDIAGARAGGSQAGSYVDLVAPGDGVLSTSRVTGHMYVSGTSFAAPFVSATAALVRAAWPKLTAPQVIERLRATATPARGGAGSAAYGAGIVDPYRAVTEGMPSRTVAVPAAAPAVPDVQELAAAAWRQRTGDGARGMTILAVATAALLTVLGGILVAGRRRGWLAGRAQIGLPSGKPVVEELPENLFNRQA
ncbi:type VII secretion-associated serine protease mycosin [Kribbella sp. NPDC056345]|uniref:type VII secretion-associated serine protease mycosin n=1 Tax=Kribbella sp. NPDC056345 TaxID=3345789 RepID=UPI0035DD1774